MIIHLPRRVGDARIAAMNTARDKDLVYVRSASQGRGVHVIYLWKCVNVPEYRDTEEMLVDDCTSSEVTNLDNKVEAENTTK